MREKYLVKHHLLILRLVIQTNFTVIKLPLIQNASHNVASSVMVFNKRIKHFLKYRLDKLELKPFLHTIDVKQ